MFLMETKQKDEEVYKMYKGTAFKNHFTVPPEGLSGGLALSWKDGVDLEILYSSANVIDTKIVFNKKNIFCVLYLWSTKQRGQTSLLGGYVRHRSPKDFTMVAHWRLQRSIRQLRESGRSAAMGRVVPIFPKLCLAERLVGPLVLRQLSLVEGNEIHTFHSVATRQSNGKC